MLCVLILLLRMALAWDSLLLGPTVLLQSCYQHVCVDLASADAHLLCGLGHESNFDHLLREVSLKSEWMEACCLAFLHL